MSSSSQNTFLTLSPEIRPAPAQPAARSPTQQTFLSLAPDVSASHPRAQRTRADSDAASSLSSGSNAGSPTLSAVVVDAAVPVANTRVLKLSPVHWGAHEEEHQADYHDLPQSA